MDGLHSFFIMHLCMSVISCAPSSFSPIILAAFLALLSFCRSSMVSVLLLPIGVALSTEFTKDLTHDHTLSCQFKRSQAWSCCFLVIRNAFLCNGRFVLIKALRAKFKVYIGASGNAARLSVNCSLISSICIFRPFRLPMLRILFGHSTIAALLNVFFAG